MANLRISVKCNDLELIQKGMKAIMSELEWKESHIPNCSKYGGKCTFGIKGNVIEVYINDESDSILNEQYTKDFLKMLPPYKECIDSVEIIYNEEISKIVCNHAFDAPINDPNEESHKNKFIKIDYLNMK